MKNARLTITLPAARYLGLKESAARQGKSMADVINESLELYGVKSRANALELLEGARSRSATLADDQAQRLAVEEVRAHRAGR